MQSETAASTATNSTATTATAKPQPPGIDIHKALEILADREGHNHDHEHNCQAHSSEETKGMGQTIDLLVKETMKKEDLPDPDQLKQQQEERRKERLQKLHDALNTMSTKELLKTVLDTQEQRVVTYKGYNESLHQILQSGNMTSYISSCAHTTAAFAVLSETINAVRSNRTLQPTLQKLLTQLQQHEKEKLNLTAAYHLERIRERNENLANLDNPTTDQRIRKLLQEGAQSLQQKIQACVEEINEIIDEIRFAMMEEEEEEVV